MDETDSELLKLIYTKVGTVMEDASVIALELGGPNGGLNQDARVRLASAVASIAALLAAVNAINQ